MRIQFLDEQTEVDKPRHFFLFPLVLLAALCGYGMGRYPVARNPIPIAKAKIAEIKTSIAKQPPAPAIRSIPPKKTVERKKPSMPEIEAAIKAVKGNAWQRARIFRRLLDSIDRADIAMAYGLMEKNSPTCMIEELRNALFSPWAGNDPHAAMTHANSLPNKYDRDDALYRVFLGWADKDPQAVVAWAQQLPPGVLRSQTLEIAILSMAHTDPQAAFELLRSSGCHSKWLRGDGGLSFLFAAWTRLDPAMALAKAAELPAGQHSKVIGTIAYEWCQKDPQAAFGWINSLPNGKEKNSILSENIEPWTHYNSQDAIAWVQALPESEEKNGFAQQVISALTQDSPHDAINFLTSLPAGKADDMAVMKLVWGWVRSDPQSTAQWVVSLPAGKMRDNAIGALTQLWPQYDPSAAGQWIVSLPDGKEKQSTIQCYINVIASRDPDIAAPWAEALLDSKERNDAIESIAQQWLKEDPAGAQTWLAKTSLPDERKQRLLKENQ